MKSRAEKSRKMRKGNVRSKTEEKLNTKAEYDNKITFFRTYILKNILDNMSDETKNAIFEYFAQLLVKSQDIAEQSKQQQNNANTKNEEAPEEKKGFGPWDMLWEYKTEAIRESSPYSNFRSYQIRNIIIKGGDDLRQEIICMQVIKKLQDIWAKEQTSLFVRPYEIIVTGPDSGVLEFVTDSISIDGLKKKYKGMNF